MLLVAPPLAACGKKGALKPPGEEPEKQKPSSS
jgi:predicted small lipoprotein YifL